MNLSDIIQATNPPKAWVEGETIPWDEPDFSRRMLKEHLTQKHNAASRRFEIIDQHVKWIHETLLKESVGRILDLACGPGFYVERFTELGHSCLGIDFSPASIAYAREQNPHLNYVESDIRKADYGIGYDLVLFIFGEFNVFKPEDVRYILTKAHHALSDDGILLLEPHSYDAIKQIGQGERKWYSSQGGLFSDEAHFCLMENFWLESDSAAIKRYYIVDAATNQVTLTSSTMQAYTDEEYDQLLGDCGFSDIRRYTSLTGADIPEDNSLFVLTAKKA
jgi:SAM-dependent methyltransferase